MKINRLVAAGVALASAVVIAIAIYRHARPGDGAMYREVPVVRADLTTTVQATGTVQPENRLEIKAPIAGRIERVLVSEGQRVRKGQVLAWMSSTERAALLDAARAEGAAEESRWAELYKPTPIMAPITGTVITRSVESGQTFTATDAVLVMSDRLTVKAQVDETDIAAVKLGQTAELTLDAYPGERLPARVDQVAFDAKTVNNVTTYTVDVLPARTPAHMRSGMTANVSFTTESRANVPVILSEAIRVENGESRVLVRGDDGTPVSRAIETGLADGKRTEVRRGLSEGDVILVPIFRLNDAGASAGSPFMPGGSRRRAGPPSGH